MATTNVPCVYVIIRDGDKMLFISREHTGFMDGNYALPSGHVEDGEEFRTAAAREVLEEVGLTVRLEDLRHIHTMHRRKDDIRVDVFFEAEKWSGTVKNMEPHKHGEPEWFSLEELPKNIMDYQLQGIQASHIGETYSIFGW